jgi:hypothetical protein
MARAPQPASYPRGSATGESFERFGPGLLYRRNDGRVNNRSGKDQRSASNFQDIGYAVQSHQEVIAGDRAGVTKHLVSQV